MDCVSGCVSACYIKSVVLVFLRTLHSHFFPHRTPPSILTRNHPLIISQTKRSLLYLPSTSHPRQTLIFQQLHLNRVFIQSMDGILTRNSATSAVPQQAQRVRRKAALSARVFVSAAARGEPMIIPDDLNSSRGSHCSGHQSSMQDKKKSATTTAAVVASASTYMAAASASVTLASIDHEPPSSIDHKPPSSDSIVSSLLLPAAASHSLSRPTINATALSASSLTSIGFSSSGSDSGSDYSSSGVSSNNTSSSSSSSASSSSNNKKKKTALSAHAVQYLKNWMMSPEHVDHPYPTEDEKVLIMNETGIVLKQLTNWFVNNRKRYWKPKVEELRRRQEGDIAGDGGEETRTIEMEFTGGCGGDGNNRNVLIRSSSPVEQGSNTNNKRHSSTRNTKKRSSNNDDDDGLLPTAKKTRNSSSSSITDGTTILSPTPIITMLLPPTTTAPSYLPSLRDDMKLNMTRVNGTNCSGTSVVSDESGSGRGSGTEEESGDDIDDDIQHVSNPLFDKSSYSSLDVMESSSSSDIELRTAHQQVMNMIDMDYSFNPLNMEETITTKDHHHQQQHQEEEHICCSILPHSCTDPKVCLYSNVAAQNHTYLCVCISSITYLIFFIHYMHTQPLLTRATPFSPVLYALHVAIGTLVNSVHGTSRVSLVIYPRTIQCCKQQKEVSQ